MRISEYIFMAYTKGAFACVELEHGYAVRTEEAIIKRDLSLLAEPLAAPSGKTPYIYTSDEVHCVCCWLGLTLLVKRTLAIAERLLVAGQIQAMLEKVTSDTKEQDELLARIAFTIDRCNPIFMKGNLGMLREEALYQKMQEAGIFELVQMMLEV